jgi:hypothetical protein
MSASMKGPTGARIILRNDRQAFRNRRVRSQESGFAYLMALFMLLFMLIASSAAILDLRTERRRQREDEMIWRGNQYVRAIRLYYRKTGHYPQNLDELQKGLPELHFLRFAAYRDPVNKSDGAWRFIYVNAAGQIIGSVKYASLQQMALMDMNGGKMPTTSSGLPGMPPVSPTGATSASAQGSASATGAQPSQGATTPPSGSSTPPDSGAGQNATPGQPSQTPPTSQPSSSQPASSQPAQSGSGVFGNPIAQQPTGPVDGPVIGGFLTGVGSTVDEPSLKVYDGGTNYNQWEFIWNPIEDQARAVQQGLGQGQGILPGLLGPGGSGGLMGQPGTPMGQSGAPGVGNSTQGAPAGLGSPQPPPQQQIP